jgi:hypothetical protein
MYVALVVAPALDGRNCVEHNQHDVEQWELNKYRGFLSEDETLTEAR